MTRAIVVFVTAPLWVPALMAASMASLVIGAVCIGMTHAVKDRPVRDRWD